MAAPGKEPSGSRDGDGACDPARCRDQRSSSGSEWTGSPGSSQPLRPPVRLHNYQQRGAGRGFGAPAGGPDFPHIDVSRQNRPVSRSHCLQHLKDDTTRPKGIRERRDVCLTGFGPRRRPPRRSCAPRYPRQRRRRLPLPWPQSQSCRRRRRRPHSRLCRWPPKRRCRQRFLQWRRRFSRSVRSRPQGQGGRSGDVQDAHSVFPLADPAAYPPLITASSGQGDGLPMATDIL